MTNITKEEVFLEMVSLGMPAVSENWADDFIRATGLQGFGMAERLKFYEYLDDKGCYREGTIVEKIAHWIEFKKLCGYS